MVKEKSWRREETLSKVVFGEREGAEGRETLKHVFGEREDEKRL